MKKRYWIFLEPYVYVSILEKEILLYNTLDGKMIHSKDKNIVNLIKDLYTIENLGVIPVELGKTNIIDSFIFDIRKHFMGDIIPITNPIKPIQLMPHLRIDNKNNKLDSFNVDNILSSLIEITFFANNKCKYCDLYHKQFDTCTKYKINDKTSDRVNIEILFDILRPCFGYLSKINIIISDPYDYSILFFLINLPNQVRKKCNIIINYKNFIYLDNSFISVFYKNLEVHITNFESIGSKQKFDKDISLNYIIQKERDLIYLAKKEIHNPHNITLFHNKDNTHFFHEQIKFGTKDLQENVMKMQQIHRNKILNTFFYGKIYVYLDGSIRLHPSTNVIGNILTESMLSITSNIINDKNNLWFLTRDKKTSCRNCIFKYICPPIAPVELELFDQKLCKINN